MVADTVAAGTVAAGTVAAAIEVADIEAVAAREREQALELAVVLEVLEALEAPEAVRGQRDGQVQSLDWQAPSRAFLHTTLATRESCHNPEAVLWALVPNSDCL